MALTCKIGGVQYAALDLMSVQIGLPTVKTQTESVPGADGELDLTAALTGGPVFGDRQITLRFGCAPTGTFDFYSCAAAVHGQRLKLELSNKSGYYIGRYTVGTPDTSLDRTTFDVTIDADPYRLAAAESSIIVPVVSTADNLITKGTPTASTSLGQVAGSGTDTVLSLYCGDTSDNPALTRSVLFKLPWPKAGSCVVDADVDDGGWYEITDASGNVYGDGTSRWISNVPAGALYMRVCGHPNPAVYIKVRNIQIYAVTPVATDVLASDRRVFPVLSQFETPALGSFAELVPTDITIIPSNRKDPVAVLLAGDTSSPYLSIRRPGYIVAASSKFDGRVTMTARRGWM